MYISQVTATNFRLFGKDENALSLKLQPGLNVLVGENDSGKSAIVDAIRYVLGTTSQEFLRFSESDFHQTTPDESGKAAQFFITLKFEDIGVVEGSRFVEHLTRENGKDVLYITLNAELAKTRDGSWFPKNIRRRSGKEGNGIEMEWDVRSCLASTFLKPLRDAENELSSGKNSRLSQILRSHGDLNAHKQTMLDIIHDTESRLEGADYLRTTVKTINEEYLEEISLQHYQLQSSVTLVGKEADEQQKLRQLFDKLELFLSHTRGQELKTRHGLGANNLLFIATELLLLENNASDANPLLLIEEPEAHLHPQAQMQLLEFLLEATTDRKRERETRTEEASAMNNHHESEQTDGAPSNDVASQKRSANPQVIVTTHSPNFASKVPVERIILVIDGKTYGLSQEETKLEATDYRFLRKFLDVTKANLFFARGVIIVEGDAENILLPTIARLINLPLEKYGVSIVKVGHIGLFRYSRIFQRKNEREKAVPVCVACLADRDLRPDLVGHERGQTELKEWQYVEKSDQNRGLFVGAYDSTEKLNNYCNKKKMYDGQNVKTFLSPKWTLEYDLATGNEEAGKNLCLEIHQAVQLAKAAYNEENRTVSGFLSEEKIKAIKTAAEVEHKRWKDQNIDDMTLAALVYKPFVKSPSQHSKAEAAYWFSQILEEKYKDAPDDLKKCLPKYLLDALTYSCTGSVQRAGASQPQGT